MGRKVFQLCGQEAWTGHWRFVLSGWGTSHTFHTSANSVSLSSAKYDFLKDAVRTGGEGSIPVSSALSPLSVH